MSYVEGPKRPSSGCVFCHARETADDAKLHVLVRGPECFSVLNLYPYNNGHLMVVPYEHVSSLDEVSPTAQAEMMMTASRWVTVVREVMKAEGFNLGLNLGAAAGAGIKDHLHLHLVPRWGGDTNFMPVVGGTKVMPELLDRTYEKLLAGWQARFGSESGSRR